MPGRFNPVPKPVNSATTENPTSYVRIEFCFNPVPKPVNSATAKLFDGTDSQLLVLTPFQNRSTPQH